ncbi:MAG: phosphoribosylaminoimidazolesuccinocarboxamide synthase [Gammaproteobacteria bacterium]|nr:MAG: phosphoribosylaminoimidazolesuccinocarboxamide synthase [Gammaproteobacteria bacterium]
MQKREELYSGKAKSVYRTDDPNTLVLAFRDDTSAFDGQKMDQLARKGKVNNRFNGFIMQHLEKSGVPTHFEGFLSDNESLVKNLRMIPLECVVRNLAAGSLCKRLGVAEGVELKPATFELFLKNDALHDPMVNEFHALSFNWATMAEIEQMKVLTFKVNEILFELFDKGSMILVDYKLEFGVFDGKVILGDEFSPDGCRIWDKETRKKLDKDRYRQGLGGVVEAYEEVADRLGIRL